ncbi:Outer membrane protein OprM [Zhongshania aliphaticivorans]|uniref:Outer membrane protein OprM n=1 Tax=Zhongshania aliphaticivorans TaxID=1470434 RepID=A0A5S9N8M9_9GAMM|nr:efflux transporter outer membrane subunit [Zhongshania aliphaticivorans]CAA0080375.1 Outer membrane protein OprM [Zhongshania aliphaticivorans]CAA0085709.1 Outer membrane protein OprM [Zhongshania aliphaticivorans]
MIAFNPSRTYGYLALSLIVGLTGCVNYKDIGSEKTILNADTLATQQSLTIDQSSSPSGEAWPTQVWWESFNDPQLNNLMAEALQNSPTLALAAAKIARANASLENSRAANFPSAALSADATRQHYTENGMYPAPLGGSSRSSANITLQTQYELDFWGRNKAATAASQSRLAATQAESASAQLMLASAIAKTYFQLAELQRFLHIGHNALKQRQQIYDLTKQRVDAGLDTLVELKQAETQLPLTRTNIEMVKENIVSTQHALAALLGAGPDRTLTLQVALPEPNINFDLALPQDLPATIIGHRPDLVAARWQVEARMHDTSVSKAAFYPNINLTAFAGYSSIGLDQLIKTSSENYGVGPALSLPIFDSGRLRANLKTRYADYDAAVANYNETLVEALRDVADQLNSFFYLQPQLEQQQLALNAATTAYNLALQRYNAGLGNYLTVLNAQSMVIQQELFHSQLLMRALTNRVEIFRALGGGFLPHNENNHITAINTDTNHNDSLYPRVVGAQHD